MIAKHKTDEQPPVLIERWLPLEILSAEQTREKSMGKNTFPPTVRLHVWWARRPLLVSRAAVLAGVLPAWSETWPKALREKFPTEQAYQQWFLRACGILGDSIAGRKLVVWAAAHDVKLKQPPFPYKRAFTVSPDKETLDTIGDLVQETWGQRTLSILDPFSGGGSIPLESMRCGFHTFANELNPVASVILKATLEYPGMFGANLALDIRQYGKLWASRVKERLSPFYPRTSDGSVQALIWVRTVKCPYTGKSLPLAPNWWLQKGAKPVAVEPVFDAHARLASYRIVKGKTAVAKLKPDLGTVKRGNAVSPWAQNQPVEGDYIKKEAQEGRMGQQLYALALKGSDGFLYRPPNDEELKAVDAAEKELARRLPAWEAQDWVPSEARKEGRADWACEIYGATKWRDTYAPRQLLAACTMLEELKKLQKDLFREMPEERAIAVMTYLALAFDKAVAYNSRQSGWHVSRQVMTSAFVRHDLSMRWAFGEFDASGNLVPWVIDQVGDAYEGLVALAGSAKTLFSEGSGRSISIVKGSAADMRTVKTGSIHSICVDPPYYDNVMYAELSDYFYVWMKRILGDVHPAFFTDEVTNKDDEAVANKARFKEMGKKADGLAKADYERKMAGAFREMHRVLRDDGVLTVMFTHKQVEAWDTLATSLIGAGFAIKSSWPVHTESEKSLHQAKKNAAQSTILLTCRKKKERKEPVWWDDIKGRVREEARAKAAEFETVGIRGVDLYIATFGPTLAILSEHWPVLSSEVDAKTGDPKPLRPEIALDLAREEVVKLRKQGLLLGRTVQFDPATDWYLMAWDAFKAEAFPGDEARKLAIALGLDLERDVVAAKRLVAKKGDMVDIQQPTARRKRDMVDGDKETFDCWIDAVHTAMMLQEEDGSAACKAFLNKTGLLKDSTFKACVQAMLNAIPRTKSKGKFVRPEAETLEAMRLAFFDDLVTPAEEEPPKVAVQATFDGKDFDEAEDEDEEEEDSES
ncbi:MAG TPA: DUF1156 domain-containing protein [Kiritimatiellia bacterium]|nr:DUF1156 domain-containing protein [Kiritimatiellia bacterium]